MRDVSNGGRRVQNVVLILSDGRRVVATVPAFWDGAEPAVLSVRHVQVGEPYDLPGSARLVSVKDLAAEGEA